MHRNPGLEFSDHGAVDVPLPLGGPTRQKHQIGLAQGPVQGLAKDVHVVGKLPQQLRLAAELHDGVGQNPPVAVVHEAGAHVLTGLHDLVAGRQDGHPGDGLIVQFFQANDGSHGR